MAGLLVGAWVGLLSAPVRGGEREDNATNAAVEHVLSREFAQANFGLARKKLKSLLDHCKKCSPETVARVRVALGLVSAQIGQDDEAKTQWLAALDADPNASLPSSGVSSSAKQTWEAVKKEWIAKNPQPDDAQKAGWVDKSAYENAKAAVAAESAGNYAECIDKDKAALTIEENLRARLHLADCEAKASKIVDALRDNAKALEIARQKNDTATVKTIGERVKQLIPRLAHVKFDLPSTSSGVSDLKVSFDERPVPPKRYGDSFTIDPGAHTVHAEGVLRGARVSYDDKVEAKDGETVVVKVTLKPAALTPGQLQCMVSAKTQEEIMACLPSNDKPLAVHAALDFSGYTDTTAVHVITPAVKAQITSPTAGWTAGASYLVDVVTAASPDLVASASPRFRDVRHAVTANGGYKPGRFGGSVYGDFSTEYDYTSRTIGGSVSLDTMDKQVTPNLGFAHRWDTIGRTGVPFDVYSKSFTTEEILAGATIIMSPASLVVIGATADLENGDQSKPYRHIPLFAPGVNVPVGASAQDVNIARLPAKPLEQLPLSRQRFSLGGRYIRRVGGTATLRIEERLYDDTWDIKASTTDAQYIIDTGSRLRVWPHLHLHAQTGASFYNRVYGATLNPDGSATIPMYRTTDRELSPMFGITGGGGARFAVTNPAAKTQLGFYATFDTLFNYYVNALYIRTRLAFYGTVGVEADFE